jgi:hypothetical protein
MPRVRPLGGTSSGLGGFRAPGLYAALLESERQRSDHHDPRWRRTEAAKRGEEAPPRFRRSRRLLDALEAGKTVIVPLPSRKWGLPWTRPDVTTVTVTSDDVVRPTDAPCSYPGNAYEERSA